jgi:DNA polymerase III epsilon subunit-like protein
LPRTYVALDLETTGLNPDKDAIIEVGAVKFRDGEIVE